MTATVVLGVDLGTTAVKACLLSGHAQVLDSSTIDYLAPSLYPPDAKPSITDVSCILVTVRAALQALAISQFPPTAIALCGQMHGIVWWSAKDLARGVDHLFSTSSPTSTSSALPWSSLISWQDDRCDRAFLDACRHHAHADLSPLASGYGLATFAHVMQHTPSVVNGLDTCGTIMDLVAFALCGHTTSAQATMDVTNAFSWGIFDSTANAWPSSSVAALGIPVEMLPQVVPSGTVVGVVVLSNAFGDILNISKANNVRVYVPMGDHPCSVLGLLQAQNIESPVDVAMINIGTSAQLCFVTPPPTDNIPPSLLGNSASSFEIRPYFFQQHLHVAAALTGGNMFAYFVDNCLAWTNVLGSVNHPSKSVGDIKMQQDNMYAKVIAEGLNHTNTTLICRPTFGGERNDTADNKGGVMLNMHLGNWSIGDMSAALARGIVANLVALFPLDKQAEFSRRRYESNQ
ncbi:hypothetical protein, variant 1 [Aphanomyces astaci]|uniref:Carbohydrate kinase FGGY N-terminal domain-containing protein n=1 Tax=Aphanomyces astaci TaxID=112090 RepID=W4G1X0_APHAT|nr:hypothetical protein, variant 1 [Aphanomyces astaci]ETV73276.1 hypothetical protein, variant 1 [Aphanomyces astaci]|eukprot:XP_009837150.1 hypothetical protein, variant 1 [Aphanomyces astaci]